MSRIKESLEEFFISKAMEESEVRQQHVISFRLNDFDMFCLEKIRNEMQLSRAALTSALIHDALIDACEYFGTSEEDLVNEWMELLKSGKSQLKSETA